MKVAFVYKQASLSTPLGICYLHAVIKKGFISQFFIFKINGDFTCLQKIIEFKPAEVNKFHYSLLIFSLK